jgi:AmmeMemoRadiSam system protein B/AmmeMemoRadiSam system protein A
MAGTFYPADPVRLEQALDACLTDEVTSKGRPVAVIAPHAGYIYSGGVAGKVYAHLGPWAGQIRRVLLLGPSHRFAFEGVAIPAATAWCTPLGELPIDQRMLDGIRGSAGVQISDRVHAPEHSLEVQLPFIQKTLGQVLLSPLVVGRISPEGLAALMAPWLVRQDSLVIVSSDLSHYHSYEEARSVDASTARRILSGAIDLRGHEACGCVCINGLNQCARDRHWQVHEVARCNSGDTAGDRDRVVGYGGYLYLAEEGFGARMERAMCSLARDSIRQGLETGQPPEVDLAGVDARLRMPAATFVTLELDDRLRGCIGSLEARRSLAEDIVQNAFAAAFRDPRFAPLTLGELDTIRIEISVLTPPEPLSVRTEDELLAALRPGRDGLILEAGSHRATFLPAVWEQLPDRRDFVRQLKQKAGLSRTGWPVDMRCTRYEAVKVREPEKV